MSETPVDVALLRGEESRGGLRGVLMLEDKTLCDTLELPWRDNRQSVSCIPPGVYRCIPHDSAKFAKVWEVTGVSARREILIHAGNTVADTHGCILVGLGVSPDGITQSQAALTMLREVLPSEFNLIVKEGG